MSWYCFVELENGVFILMKMGLEGDYIEDVGAIELAKVLANNEMITTLILGKYQCNYIFFNRRRRYRR